MHAVEQVTRSLGGGDGRGEVSEPARVEGPALQGAARAQIVDRQAHAVQGPHRRVLLGHGLPKARHPLAGGQARDSGLVEEALVLVQAQRQLVHAHRAEAVGSVHAEHGQAYPVAPDLVLVHAQVPVRGLLALPERIRAGKEAALEVVRDGPLAVLVQVPGHLVRLRPVVLGPVDHAEGRVGGGGHRQAVVSAQQALVVHAPVIVLLDRVVAQVVIVVLARARARHAHLLDQAVVLVDAAGGRERPEARAEGVALLEAEGVDVLAGALAGARVVHVAHLVRVEVAQHPRVEGLVLGVVCAPATHVLRGLPLAHGLVVEQRVQEALPYGPVRAGVGEHDAPGQQAPLQGPLELRAGGDQHRAVVLVMGPGVLLQGEVVRVVARGEADRLVGVGRDLAHDGALLVGLDVAHVVEHLRQVQGVKAPRAGLEPRERRRFQDRRQGGRVGDVLPQEGVVHRVHDGSLAPQVGLRAVGLDDGLGGVPAVELAVALVVDRHGRALDPVARLHVVGARSRRRCQPRACQPSQVGEDGVERRREGAGSPHGIVHDIESCAHGRAGDQALWEGAGGVVVRCRGLVVEEDAPGALRRHQTHRLQAHARAHELFRLLEKAGGTRAVLRHEQQGVRLRQAVDPRVAGNPHGGELGLELLVPLEGARLLVISVPDDGPGLWDEGVGLVRVAVPADAPQHVGRAAGEAQVRCDVEHLERQSGHRRAERGRRQAALGVEVRGHVAVEVPAPQVLEIGLEGVARGREAPVVVHQVIGPGRVGLAALRGVAGHVDANAAHHHALVVPVEGELLYGEHEGEVETPRDAPAAALRRGVDGGVELAHAPGDLQVLLQRLKLREHVEERAQAVEHGRAVLV